MGGGFWGADMISPQIGFIAGENTIFKPLVGKTTDSGQTWDFVAFYLNNNEGRATGVDFTDEFVGFVSSRVWDGRGAISKTTDAGINWQTTFINNSLWGIDFPISNTGQIGYAVGDIGKILKTYDAGENWHEQVSSTSEKLNKVYFLDIDNGFVAGDNGLILKTTNGGESVTGTYDNNSTAFNFILSQNYPNPFNPSTKIKFTIPQSSLPGRDGRGGFVTLRIYDVLGNEVATLVNEEKPPGTYEAEFSTDQYNNLSSGVYFYQLKAGSPQGQVFIETKKMVLMR
ncbi:Ycf48-like protein [bacterium BMS3Abin03]|nr:Ycf48-like protein [bacterium BMS3Abin03]